MTIRSHGALWLWVWIALGVDVARAQVALDWSAPSGCPDAAAVQRAIDDAAGPWARRSSVKVDAEVEQSAAGYALQLSVQTATGASREQLVATDCALFARLIAVKVSLLVTDSAPAAEGGSDGSPSDASRAACGDTSCRAAARRDKACRAGACRDASCRDAADRGAVGRAGACCDGACCAGACRDSDAARALCGGGLGAEAARWSVRAQGVVATAPVPAPAFGVVVGAGHRSGLLRFEVAASYLFPRERAYPEQVAAGGTFQAWSAALRGCVISPWPRAAALELAGCAGIEGGLMRGRGFGVMPVKVTDQMFLMASAGLSAAVPLSARLALRADVDVLLGVVRPEYFVRNLGILHRVASVGTRGILGIELRWP